MASTRRRFPEIDLEAERLIERLVSERRAELRSRPYLIDVKNWSSLTTSERRLITEARNVAKSRPSRGSTRSGSRGPTKPRPHQPSPPHRQSAKDRYGSKRRAWLERKVPDYRLTHGYERTAWREAYDRHHVSTASRLIVAVVAFGLVTYASRSWVAGVVVAVVLLVAVAVGQAARIRSRGQALVAVFAEAQEQSRHIPAALRAAVLERDHHRCRYCKAGENLHIDHKIPYSRGGVTELSNLQTLCATCNLRKGARQRKWFQRR